MRKLLLRKKGFTLVELLVVIAVIAILVTIVIIAINPQTVIRNSQDTKIRTEMNQVKTSLQLYFNENNRYPDKDTEFDASTGSVNFVPTYIRQLPTFAISYEESGTDYDAAADVNNITTEDTNSETKCTSDGDNGASGDYWICPD